jgi:hypothetical protein
VCVFLCLIVCDLKISTMKRPRSEWGCDATENIICILTVFLDRPMSLHRKSAAVTHLTERGLSFI